MHKELPTFASDFTNRASWKFVLLALHVGALCFRVCVCEGKRLGEGVTALKKPTFLCFERGPFFVLPRVTESFRQP